MPGRILRPAFFLEETMHSDDETARLIRFSRSLGASDVRVIARKDVRVEDRLRTMCERPRCPMFGSSIHCPPHVMKPGRFREYLDGFAHLLAFKFDVPMEALSGDRRHEAGRLLHESTASIEKEARALGFERACGFSSGGCRQTLCGNEIDCSALRENGSCRYPDIARPSLSGMGVNWYALSEKLGWSMMKDEEGRDSSSGDTAMLSGLVLLE